VLILSDIIAFLWTNCPVLIKKLLLTECAAGKLKIFLVGDQKTPRRGASVIGEKPSLMLVKKLAEDRTFLETDQELTVAAQW